MSNENLQLEVGQAHELKLALRRYDWDNALIKRLCEKDCEVLGHALDLLRGDAEAVPVRRVVDLNADPVLDDNQCISVVKHTKMGKKFWDEARMVVMDPTDLQYISNSWHFRDQSGRELRRIQRELLVDPKTLRPRYLRGQRLLNINMRDYLLANQHLISQEWRWYNKPILFWGTVMRNDHCMWVPGMHLVFGRWEGYGRRVEDPHDAWLCEGYDNPAVVLV